MATGREPAEVTSTPMRSAGSAVSSAAPSPADLIKQMLGAAGVTPTPDPWAGKIRQLDSGYWAALVPEPGALAEAARRSAAFVQGQPLGFDLGRSINQAGKAILQNPIAQGVLAVSTGGLSLAVQGIAAAAGAKGPLSDFVDQTVRDPMSVIKSIPGALLEYGTPLGYVTTAIKAAGGQAADVVQQAERSAYHDPASALGIIAGLATLNPAAISRGLATLATEATATGVTSTPPKAPAPKLADVRPSAGTRFRSFVHRLRLKLHHHQAATR